MTVPTVCPHCGAPVERDSYDRGVWRLYRCTRPCGWADTRRKAVR